MGVSVACVGELLTALEVLAANVSVLRMSMKKWIELLA